ncbi:MAG: hypothetical protein RL266_203 [Bacteroidota bacterium]|jgi:hypothetical protein
MKKYVVGFFLTISLLFIGFIVGGTIAKYFFVNDGNGLAAAGTAAILALFGAAIGLIVAVILIRKLEENIKMTLTLVLFVISLVLAGLFFYQFKERQRQRQLENATRFGIHDKGLLALSDKIQQTSVRKSKDLLKLADGKEMGIGIVSIAPENGKVLRFYGRPKHFELPENLTALDSLTFKTGEHYVDIATASPYFVPEYMKLDYGILHLVAVTVQQDWIEVIVNRTNGQTNWLYKEDVVFSYWPQFLLNVHSVELLNPVDFPPRIKPMDHASSDESVNARDVFYPISVKDDWLQVHSDKEVDHEIWVRWKHDGVLLVRYSLMS